MLVEETSECRMP